MFRTISEKIQRDSDYPYRQYQIDLYTRVLNGTLYDILKTDFNTERNNGTGEYIPVRERRPSVRYALCKTVVDDSVSLLFSEGHFPAVVCADDTVEDTLNDIIKESKLNQIMMEAAIVGSVGSVAIFFKIINGRVFFEVKNTMYLTPVWKEDAPDTLQSITEKYKVKGKDLLEIGYAIDEDDVNANFWFMRTWNEVEELWFIPQKVSEKAPFVKDNAKSKAHNLGFVPVEWVKNLPPAKGIDGACTFLEAIDTSIEIDYQLSQAGRGLKYSSDPTLLIKEPSIDEQGQMIKGGGNAIVVSEGGDAKMLEINGTAAQAVIEYVRMLRELALESIHGNRANADKLSAAQSGRAMELMNQQLIWLADKLRISYGEGALLSLLNKIVLASQKIPLIVFGKKVTALNLDEKISLRWSAWYQPTYADKQTQAETLTTLRTGGLLSRETAISSMADSYDIEDVKQEESLIDSDPPQPEAKTPKLAKPNPNSDD